MQVTIFAVPVAFAVGAVLGGVFHAWLAKQASDAKIRVAQAAADAKAAFDKAVADAVARALNQPKP